MSSTMNLGLSNVAMAEAPSYRRIAAIFAKVLYGIFGFLYWKAIGTRTKVFVSMPLIPTCNGCGKAAMWWWLVVRALRSG